MGTNILGWLQRLVALVFAVGLVGLIAAVVTVVREAEGVPPLPVFAGLVGAAGLILLAGGCLALISMANSMQRGVDVLQKIAAQGGRAPQVAAVTKPFTPTALHDAPKEAENSSLPARPAGRRLVAER